MQRTDLYMAMVETSWWYLNSNHKQMGKFDHICSYEYFISSNNLNSYCLHSKSQLLQRIHAPKTFEEFQQKWPCLFSIRVKGADTCIKMPSETSALNFNLIESYLLLSLSFLIMVRKLQKFTIRMFPPWSNFCRRHFLFFILQSSLAQVAWSPLPFSVLSFSQPSKYHGWVSPSEILLRCLAPEVTLLVTRSCRIWGE